MTLLYSLGDSKEADFSIYDISGRLIKKENLNVNNTKLVIDGTELNAGAYYYVINSEGKKLKTDKLIIVK